MKNGEKSIHPLPSKDVPFNSTGLKKREYFAGLALKGILSNTGKALTFSTAAKEAIGYADALLAELEKPQS